jgi:hypothetical protein
MNNAPQPSGLKPELLALLPPQRGRWLRFLTALAALLTAACGVATALGEMPISPAQTMAVITVALLGIKEAVIFMGDILDDGLRNNSFGDSPLSESPSLPLSESPVSNPSTLRQWFLIPLACFLCVGCASESSTDAEISRAQLALSGARITLVVAQSQFAAMQADPKTPAWKVQATKMAVSEAQAAVETESLRLRSIMAARNVARLNAPMTSAK